jgi:O-antigen/teichoic acid export membrane protein
MTEIGDTTQSPKMARIQGFLTSRRGVLRDYFTAISGSAGRLVFSLAYFVALANTLSIADFGLFATASAAGVMLSRILAFGFISALYRVATVRPKLIGAFTGGFILLGLLSLPVLVLAGWLTFALFFASDMTAWIFATVVFAEALLWRPVELAVIVNNGMGKFGRAAILVIMGTLLRAAAALAFIFWPVHDLATWSNFYVAANVVSLVIAFAFFYPRQRLRFRPELYWRRLADSIYVAGAEVLFYLQMEFDKLLVLSIGGPHLAGIYAIVMRLVDLTAIPIRTFTMMLVQKMMRAPEMLARLGIKAMIESGVLVISTLALATLAIVLYFFPRALGGNVSEAAPLVGLALLVPAFRNLVEYHAELLFARGQTLIRAINLALLASLKGILLWWALTRLTDTAGMVLSLNLVFAALYLASALLTYSMLKKPAKTF